MEDQLQLMNEMDKKFRIGDEIEGEVLSIQADQLVVSLVGYKSDSVIPFKELTYSDNLDKCLSNIKVGDKVKAKVIKLKNEDNYVVLSRLEYLKEESFAVLKEYYDNNTVFNITIKEAKEKGLVGFFKGVRIFVPASHIDTKFVKDTENLVGSELSVKLIDFSTGNPSKVVASRRVILEEERAIIENEAWSNLNLGDIVKVEVKRFATFGAFVNVNGIDGLIHLSQISWKHVKSAEEVLSIGQIVEAKVITLDKETKKLSLSIKELIPEPWSTVEDKYPVGSIVLSKVVRITDFGAFVELEAGVDGLVHISKISHNHIKHPSEALSIGEEVKCKILEVNREAKKIALSIKDAE